MFTKVRHWLAFLIIGPAIGCGLMLAVFRTGIDQYVPTGLIVVAAAFMMFVVPLLAFQVAWWAAKKRFGRRLEREEDVAFFERNARRIREARERSWRNNLR